MVFYEEKTLFIRWHFSAMNGMHKCEYTCTNSTFLHEISDCRCCVMSEVSDEYRNTRRVTEEKWKACWTFFFCQDVKKYILRRKKWRINTNGHPRIIDFGRNVQFWTDNQSIKNWFLITETNTITIKMSSMRRNSIHFYFTWWGKLVDM
jgi:hypothetical protein